MRPLAVLRPEPGNTATAGRIIAAGGRAVRLPLFAIQPLPWDPPAPDAHDALFLTSANAVRHAGAALAGYRDLPVYAVGRATAAAAEAAGLRVALVGERDGRELAERARAAGVARGLHLAGRDRATEQLAPVSRVVPVYASEPLPMTTRELPPLAGTVALVHSPRAGARLAALLSDRADVRLAAISAAAAEAAGDGWAAVAVAPTPDDVALVAAGLSLAGAGSRD